MTTSAAFALLCASMVSEASAGVRSIRAEPAEVVLSSREALAQILVDGVLESGATADLSGSARFEVRDPSIAVVESGGLARPLRAGETVATVRVGERSATVKIKVQADEDPRPVDFESEIVPILSKHGCNSGGCHGKSAGQNGFRLSLLGFDAKFDHESLALEGRGRRVFPAAPELSLFLRKPSGASPHGGGRKFEKDSSEYRTIARWIRQGMPFRSGRSRTLRSIEVAPDLRLVPSDSTQQLRAVARYDDGTIVDVTRLSQCQSNAAEIAEVDDHGHISTRQGVGEAAVMVRHGGMVSVSRVVVPAKKPDRDWTAPDSDNFIDRIVFKRLKELGLRPSEAATDAEFARRSSLDIRGVLPTPAESAEFERDQSPKKRAAWVDRLIASPEYADYFASKWSTILKNKRVPGAISQQGTFAFHGWIRQALAENKPYDRFVSEIVTSRGDTFMNPAVVWYRQVRTVEERVDDTAQLFLGVRIQCARCHHHPFEKWSQDDYYGFASIFARIGDKSDDPVSPNIYLLPSGLASNPVTKLPREPKPLGGEAIKRVGPKDDPRAALATWLGRPDNPYFAKALVNRYWKHFLGRGLVEPEDDFRVSNPPSNPELLDALAEDFIAHRYDLKRLVKLIASSKAYDRSSEPNLSNESDRRNHARFYARRLPAEVLLDAINAVTGLSERFQGLPEKFRATQLPDDGYQSRFLDTFGRPKRESVCECERSSEANLSQTLLLVNSPEIHGKLVNASSRVATLTVDPRSDAEKVTELYLLALARRPVREEIEVCLAHLSRRREEKQLRQGFEDLVWTLINTKEFLFNN